MMSKFLIMVAALFAAFSVYATPPPLTAEQIFVTDCPNALEKGRAALGLFELVGQRNGRNHYRHVIEGARTEIWFGQPARVPGQIVFDSDDSGPRKDSRWLIGHGPEETYYQVFVDNDDPRPPRAGWEALFSATINAPCLVLGPAKMPAATMAVGVLGLGLDIPVTFRKQKPFMSSPHSVTFTDSVSGTRWWLERRNCGVAFANPPDMTLRRRLRQARGIANLREVTKPPNVTALPGTASPPSQTIFLYRSDTFSSCAFYANGGNYTIRTEGNEADRFEREALLERLCVGHRPGMFGMDRPLPERLRVMMTDFRVPSHFEGLESTMGLLRLHDKKQKVWVKLLSWVLKGGSPYNGVTEKNIRRRLLKQGCKARRVRRGKLGHRSGWRARCTLPSPLDVREKVNVFTFVSPGENVWMVTLWAEDWDWAQIESYADSLFAGVRLH